MLSDLADFLFSAAGRSSSWPSRSPRYCPPTPPVTRGWKKGYGRGSQNADPVISPALCLHDQEDVSLVMARVVLESGRPHGAHVYDDGSFDVFPLMDPKTEED